MAAVVQTKVIFWVCIVCRESLFWSFRGSFCFLLQGDCIQLRGMLK